jgi:hypothetical protein
MTIADSQALRDLAEEMKRWAVERQGRRNYEMDMIIEMRKLNDAVDEINTRMVEAEVNNRRDQRRGQQREQQQDQQREREGRENQQFPLTKSNT